MDIYKMPCLAWARIGGYDLSLHISCNCPNPKYSGDPALQKVYPYEIRLTGYADDNFFENVNKEMREGKCPNCQRGYMYQWKRNGVLFAFTDDPAYLNAQCDELLAKLKAQQKNYSDVANEVIELQGKLKDCQDQLGAARQSDLMILLREAQPAFEAGRVFTGLLSHSEALSKRIKLALGMREDG